MIAEKCAANRTDAVPLFVGCFGSSESIRREQSRDNVEITIRHSCEPVTMSGTGVRVWGGDTSPKVEA